MRKKCTNSIQFPVYLVMIGKKTRKNVLHQYVGELIFFVFKSQESGFDVNFEKRKRALASMIGMSESNCA